MLKLFITLGKKLVNLMYFYLLLNQNLDCPWGDEASWCSATISKDPGKCYISDTGRTCCGSCNARRTGPPGMIRTFIIDFQIKIE